MKKSTFLASAGAIALAGGVAAIAHAQGADLRGAEQRLMERATVTKTQFFRGGKRHGGGRRAMMQMLRQADTNNDNALTQADSFGLAGRYVDTLVAEYYAVGLPTAHSYVGHYYSAIGDHRRAAAEFVRYRDRSRAAGDLVAAYDACIEVATAYARLGDLAGARREIETVPTEVVGDLVLPQRNAYYHANVLLATCEARGHTAGAALVDSMVASYNAVAALSQDAVINELNERYEERERLDEIASLSEDLDVEREASAARLLAGATAVALLLTALAALYFVARQRRRLARANEQVTRLNRELNHRAANQLGLAYEMVAHQRAQLQDESARASLDRTESQLMALKTVNRALASSAGDQLRADEVYREVAENLHRASPHAFALRLDLAPVTLPADQVVKSALVINELISNSIKYALVERGTDAEVAIALATVRDDVVAVDYRDNGPGKGDRVRGTGVGSELTRAFLADLEADVQEPVGQGGYRMRFSWARTADG